MKVSDIGDINPELSLEDAHNELRERVKAVLLEKKVPFIVGGGNDQVITHT